MNDPAGGAGTTKPLFVDNRNGNTLAHAITTHLAALRREGRTPAELCVASCYFNPQGLELIATEARRVPRIRLLLGADPTPESMLPRRTPYDPTEPEFTRRRVHEGLSQLERRLKHDRNLLPFDLAEDRAIRSLLEFLHSGHIEVRRYEGHFLHAKAFLFRGAQRGLLAGSANLTRAGLQNNLELVLGHHEDPLVARVEEWFESLWEEAVPFDLAAIYAELLAEVPPYLVYLKVLWHLYHDELEEEERETGSIPITTFQKHGVWRARKILAKYGGVMIADGVGLGKTFTAGEIIRDYRERRQRVLLACPASLRDTTWERFLNDFQLLVECLSYEELANDVQLGGDQQHLKNPLDDYALVVVDEAHNYRNPDTPKRAAILRKLLAGKRRDLLLLTATPVNNSLWDLFQLLHFFMKQDAWLADRGVLSIRERFEQAMREDPFSLSPDLLYPIIDATTVKRTRRFIKKHYAGDTIRGPDGRMTAIQFPKPVASSIAYDLDEALPGFFDRLEEILMPDDGQPLLRMARYQPERYPRRGGNAGQDTALVGLLRSALLKRFESSAEAFRRTVGRMLREHEAFLEALKRGRVVRKEFFQELSAAEDEGDIDEILDGSNHVAEDASAYDVARLRSDVESDLELLREMASAAAKIGPDDDPKLAALVDTLAAIAKQAEGEATDEEDARQKRKVLVFSHYEDTIDWIEVHVQKAIARDRRLAAFQGRIASVSGTEVRGGVAREKALHGFAPVSTGALPPDTEDRFDLLLCTDVLAEGMNLQQCRNVVNYDLPWNPMRLVQRHGRVDRIGSPHPRVFLRTFFPDAQLDRLLDLEARVRHKLAQAAASVGVEEAPIEAGATGEQSFAETRDEIEKLHREDASIYEAGGTAGAAQTGEEYRQELRRALAKYGEAIRDLPWRSGSGMRRGERAGHLFCATVDKRIFLRFVPLREGEILSELGTCLRLLECSEETPRALSDEMALAAYASWERARRSMFDAWAFETDPANLQPKVRKLNRDVAAFLRAHAPADVAQERLHRCLDAIESPWPRREERLLRLVWEREFASRGEKARALVEEVERIGAEPFQAPDPLPPIELDEIHLICWMAFEPEASAPRQR